MTGAAVQNALIKHLAGPLSEKKRSVSKGLSLGVLSFGLFEFGSVVSNNLPRIPVPWLLAITICIAQIALFIKIARFVRYPRKEDFFFVAALSSVQRNELAQQTILSVHQAIFPFIISSLSVVIPLEYLILQERSIINLVVVPAAVLAASWLIFIAAIKTLKWNLIKPSAKDERHSEFNLFSRGTLSVFLSSAILKISHAAGLFAPQKIRPYVIRNFMYLLRSDPLQLPLISCAAPALLFLFMMLIGNPNTPFGEFFTILTIFLLNFYYTAHLQDATIKLQECPYYQYGPKQMLSAHIFTIAVVSIPCVLAFLGFVNFHLISVIGLTRLLTFLLALIAAFFINCRAAIHPRRKDSDSATDFLLFAFTIAPGLFIPVFGWVFPLVSIFVTAIIEWEAISEKS